MNRDRFGRQRRAYLKEHHPRVYHELKDDGVLEAHLRHVQARAFAYYETLLGAGLTVRQAEKKVLDEVIAPH